MFFFFFFFPAIVWRLDHIFIRVAFTPVLPANVPNLSRLYHFRRTPIFISKVHRPSNIFQVFPVVKHPLDEKISARSKRKYEWGREEGGSTLSAMNDLDLVQGDQKKKKKTAGDFVSQVPYPHISFCHIVRATVQI